MIEAYNESIMNWDNVWDLFPMRYETDTDMIELYSQTLPDASEIEFPVPNKEEKQ